MHVCVHVHVCVSDEKRERGNTLYARGEFSRAVDVYTRYVSCLCLLLDGSSDIPYTLLSDICHCVHASAYCLE